MYWKAVLGKSTGKEEECRTGALTTCFLLSSDRLHVTLTALLFTQAGPQYAASPWGYMLIFGLRNQIPLSAIVIGSIIPAVKDGATSLHPCIQNSVGIYYSLQARN